ncbi:MAG TPA: hypothetical protein VIM11_07295 [Tepidisphaeraceae bacterium]|jgi:hypothetical protein
MTVQTVKLGGKQFVIVPKREFDRIHAQARRQADQDRQDAGDVAESKRRAKEPSIPLVNVRKRLGCNVACRVTAIANGD